VFVHTGTTGGWLLACLPAAHALHMHHGHFEPLVVISTAGMSHMQLK
jgi:hypothetical protein